MIVEKIMWMKINMETSIHLSTNLWTSFLTSVFNLSNQISNFLWFGECDPMKQSFLQFAGKILHISQLRLKNNDKSDYFVFENM